MKKYLFPFVIILFGFLSSPVFVLAVSNAGFIPGQIWYSKETLSEGDTVNIHTAVWNGDKDSISVKVEFYDKNVILGARDVVLASSELRDVYIPWKITSGDHVISAKIISSLATVSGKKENIVLDRMTTSSDEQFVPVLSKNNQGVPEVAKSTLSDALNNQIDKTKTEINNILPKEVSDFASSNFDKIDSLREETSEKVALAKVEVEKDLDILKSKEQKTITDPASSKANIQDSTEKPIIYVKLFLLSILGFILSKKIIFYVLSVLIIFFVLRFVFRKIRNK